MSTLLAALPLTAGVGGWWLGRRRHEQRWQTLAKSLGLQITSANDSVRTLTGVFRGRAVTVAGSGRELLLTVRTINRARLIDSIRAGEPLPAAAWLNALSIAHLSALNASANGAWSAWRLEISGRSLRFTCTARASDPDHVRFILNLACDLAEGVDSIGATFRLQGTGYRLPGSGIREIWD